MEQVLLQGIMGATATEGVVAGAEEVLLHSASASLLAILVELEEGSSTGEV